jgi:hypothetical protein
MRIGSRLIGPVRKEIVMSATWKIDAYALQRLLAGIERPWHGGRLLFGWSLFQSTAADDGEVVTPQNVASHVVISRDREVALRASQV